jgi:hypothetical protein
LVFLLEEEFDESLWDDAKRARLQSVD